MNGKDLDLIALSYALSRYRTQGSLVNEVGEELSLSDLKVALLAGTPYANDSDININIGSLETESNVTIIEQTVDCEEHNQPQNTSTVVEETTTTEQEQPLAEPIEEKQEDKSQGFGGRLFQYFKGGKNE